MAVFSNSRESSIVSANTNRDPLIECSDIIVDFGLTRALDRVSVTVYPGEIVGLVGANGAGKSTLARVLVGEVPHGRYRGSYRISGEEMRFRDTSAAHDRGVALVHQEGAMIQQLSIGENVMLTFEPSRYGIIDWDRLHASAAQALSKIGLEADTRSLVQDHGGIALMEMAEVGRAIARGSRLFVFDESTSALGAEEVRSLLKQMAALRDSGAAIIFVSHRLDEVLSISSRIVVLRDGKVVMDAPRDGQTHDSLVEAMLGLQKSRQPTSSTRQKNSAVGRQDAALSLQGFFVRRSNWSSVSVRSINLDVYPGEILGLYGSLGAGKTELLQGIYGLLPEVTGGELRKNGETIPIPDNPRQAIGHGIAFVSSDRQENGVVPQQSVLDNLLLGRHRSGLTRWKALIDAEAEASITRGLIDSLGIKTAGADQPISDLSGGNQQKVIIGRALLNQPDVLLLDEPTRGIDVSAKQDVYRLIRQTAKDGTAIIFSSMEEDEIIEISDRVVILRDGRQVGVVAGCEPHELLVRAGGAIDP